MPAPRAGGPNTLDDTGGPQEWFNSLPVVTRYWFGITAFTTLAVNFGFLSIRRLLYVWDPIWNNFEVWRFITPFFYAGPFKLNTLFLMYMIQSFSNRYEKEPYNTGAGGGTADYIFALMFGSAMLFLTYPVMMMVMPVAPIFTRNLLFFVLYVWSKRHPTAPASIWGVQMKAIHLPFAYAALSLLMGDNYSDLLHGIAIGHLFYFLVDVVPLVYGKDMIHTPQFLIDQLGVGAYVAPAAPAAGGRGGAAGNNAWQPPGRANPPADPARTSRGHNWGSGGQRLGSD